MVNNYQFIYFYNFLYTYIEMVNKYSQEDKGKLQKNHTKDTKIFLKKKKRKSVSIIGIEIKIFLKKKNKRKLSIREIII